LNRAKKQGVTTLTGWCLSNAAVPYFPFFEAFGAYFSAGSGEENVSADSELRPSQTEPIEPENLELKSWLLGPAQAERLGRPQSISPQAWKDQTFAAVARAAELTPPEQIAPEDLAKHIYVHNILFC
jgi:hypothetical protein